MCCLRFVLIASMCLANKSFAQEVVLPSKSADKVQFSGNGWRAQRAFTSSDAIQAAVSDGQYVYAISNRRVSKYDPKTGRKLQTSTGEAEHLNSGFYWKGEILCAHSNYPEVPEKSEVKSLSPKTMKISTWKSFGEYGGSLTWIIRAKDSWFCNFAKYGVENSKTFLVRFDDDWKEIARWRYPEEVISQLGKHSLSGGIWLHGQLWVTGHDEPKVYRLNVPTNDSELDYVGSFDVPFSGQGIAVDLSTKDGLVGNPSR